MTRLMYRKNERTRLTRMLSLVLAVVFTLSFTGLGRVFATDEPVGQNPAADSVAAPVDPAPVEAAPEEGGEQAAPEAPAEEPVAEESAPEAQIDKGEDKGEDEGDGMDEGEDDGEDEGEDGEPPYDPGGYETVEGNPSLGDNCFKFYGSGTYEVELDDGTMVTIVVTVEETEDGEFVSWTSTEPVESVVVKGGPNANIYGGGDSGSGLHAPLNPGNDEMWPDVSYVAFCFGEGGGGGEEPTGAIHVLKFNDENGNGEQDEGEEPLEGWTFVLTNMEDEELGTEVTDDEGMAHFAALEDGEYMVTEVLEEGWEVTTGSLSQTVTIENGEAVDLVFGNRMMAAIDVEKSVNVETAEPGDVVVWTITITNTGMVPIEHFELYDELLGLDEDVMDYLAPGESHTMDVEWTVPMDAEPGMIENCVEILAYPEGGSPIPGEDCASFEVIVPGTPMVEVTKSADVDSIEPGGLITYTVTITNTSDTAASDFTVIDDYDEDMVMVVDSGLATDNGDTLMWSWAGMELAPGATVSDSYTVMVDGDLLNGDLITNTVTIPEFGSEDTETVEVVASETPMVEVTKSADVDTVAPGGQITYTVTITNTSDVAATDFTVIDDYDESMVSVVDPGLATDNGDTLTWSWAGVELAAGATVTDTYTVMADGDLLDGDLITNTVTIPEFGSEDTETVEVVVPTAPMVEVTKLADVETVLPGGEINYTVTYINTSEAVADDFTIIDDYPEDLVTITDAGGATDDGDTLTWMITEPLAPGEERTVSYTAVADADLTAGTQILNTVAIPEFETSDSEIVIVGEDVVPGGITITKTANRGTVEPGGFITYTISYTNTGDVTLNNFTIVDDYPEDFVTISDPNGGVVAGGMITWAIDTPLEPGQTRAFNYLVRANGDLPVGTDITNVATIVEFDVSDTATVEVVAAQFLPFTPTGGTTSPFLPFTGQELLVTLFAVMLSAMIGVALRLAGRKVM